MAKARHGYFLISLQAHGKVLEKRFQTMVTFFSKTFANVTHLDVSRCGLTSSAAEVGGVYYHGNRCMLLCV